MQVFKCEINKPNGKINHNVHCDWDDQGNLHFCEHDLGEGVKEIWGTDEYEYFMMIHQKDVAKFILCFRLDELLFLKGFFLVIAQIIFFNLNDFFAILEIFICPL